MPTPVNIPLANFEYTADFKRPVIALLGDRTILVQGVIDSLTEWDPELDDIEVIASGKLSEQGVRIKLPKQDVSFFFGGAAFKFAKLNPTWDTAEQTILMLQTAMNAVLSSGQIAIATQHTAVSMHAQVTSGSFLDVLKPFLSPKLMALENASVSTGASIVKWDNRKVVLDGSASYANAFFVRMERTFGGSTALGQIAETLRSDQRDVFSQLDIEEELQW